MDLSSLIMPRPQLPSTPPQLPQRKSSRLQASPERKATPSPTPPTSPSRIRWNPFKRRDSPSPSPPAVESPQAGPSHAVHRATSSPSSLSQAFRRASIASVYDDAEDELDFDEDGIGAEAEASIRTHVAASSISIRHFSSPRTSDVDVGSRIVDILLGPAYAELSLADRQYAAAVRVLHRLQTEQSSPAQRLRPSPRRVQSLPSLHEPVEPAQRGWNAFNVIFRPAPTPPRDEPAPMPDLEDTDEEEQRLHVLYSAADSVRITRTRLLERLSQVGTLAGTLRLYDGGGPQGYEHRLLLVAFAISDRTPACLRLLERRDLDTLRSAARTLVQAFETARPGATARQLPRRASSLPCDTTGELTGGNIEAQAAKVLEALKAFDASYAAFDDILCVLHFSRSNDAHRLRSHAEARQLRRTARADRRNRQIRIAARTMNTDDAPLDISVLSTSDLAQQCLDRALDAGLLSEAEISSLDPRCFVAVPRLCTLWGLETAQLPTDWQERPLAFYLPRVCRAVSPSTTLQVRHLAPQARRDRLAALLAGVERTEGETAADREVDELYREIAAVADRASQGSSAKAWARLMGKLLRPEPEGSTAAQHEIMRDLALA